MTRRVSEGELRDHFDAVKAETDQELDGTRLRTLLRRVEGEIAKPPPRPRAWVWASAAVAGVATAALAVWIWAPLRPPAQTTVRIALRGGDVRIDNGDATEMLSVGARIEVGPHGVLGLAVSERARVVLRDTRVELTKAKRMSVIAGRAFFSTTPVDNTPFEVLAGSARVAARGTLFAVGARDGLLDDVEVFEGVVDVHRPDQSTVTLRAGQNLSKRAPAAPPEWLEGMLRAPIWSGREWGHLGVESTPGGVPVRIDGQVVGHTPLSTRWPPGAATIELSKDGFIAWRKELVIPPNGSQRVSATLETTAVPSPKQDAPTTDSWRRARAALRARRCKQVDEFARRLLAPEPDRAEAHLLRAECWLRQGRWKKALSIYDDLVRDFPLTPAVETALFERAKLNADNGRDEHALADLERLLARYGDGSFARPAYLRRCELLLTSGRHAEARICLSNLVRRYPELGGTRITLLEAEVARLSEDLERAVSLYRESLSGTLPPDLRERALYHLATCLRSSGMPGLRQAAQEYAKEFPRGKHAHLIELWLEESVDR